MRYKKNNKYTIMQNAKRRITVYLGTSIYRKSQLRLFDRFRIVKAYDLTNSIRSSAYSWILRIFMWIIANMSTISYKIIKSLRAVIIKLILYYIHY